MRLVIDLQGAQSTGSRKRGIGRYSLSIAQALARNRGEHEVLIALSGRFPETIEPIRSAFDGLLPQQNILVWDAPGLVSAANAEHDTRRRAAELLRESFLASLSPDWVLVSSLFEGVSDDAVTSIGMLSGAIPTAPILYDLIPLIHRNTYLQNPTIERWYLDKLDQLRRADLLLSISASSGQEAVTHLGFDSQSVANISTAAEDHFCPKPVSEATRAQLAAQYGLVRPFVMYTGGVDHRKNIEGLIAAYARLPAMLRSTHQLAVVCSIQQPDRERLQQLAKDAGLAKDELILTGFVPDDALLACYRACKLFVFPSWHEGFGLPALEAMQCGKAVIAGNTSSLPEVVGREDALFDPLDAQAMAQKIEQVLTDDAYRAELERHGLVQAQKFSWDESARRAWQAFMASPRVQTQSAAEVASSCRPRLAYVSPLPPEASGISDYSAELLPELARHYRIEVVVAQSEVADPWVRANCPVRDVAWFRQHAGEFDRVLYHFGNSSFHSHMFALLQEHPGVVVLHDFFLSGIVAHRDFLGETSHGWARALVESHGWPALATRFLTQNTAEVVYSYPCNLQVLQDALGVIVHAEHSCQLARTWYGAQAAADWQQIPLLRQPADGMDRASARRALGVAEDDFVVCSFGLLGPTKLNHRLLSAWLASSLAQDRNCRLVFVGQNHGGDYGAELLQTIRGHGTSSRIEITGRVDMPLFQQWLAAADIGVQLRTLSRGETSAAVLDCMNHGLATIVNANGAMGEIATEAVWMLPDAFEDAQLIEALTSLRHDANRRAGLGLRARAQIAERHQPRRCAEQYAEAIEGFYRKAAVGPTGVLEAIAAHEPGLPEREWPGIARSLANNNPPKPRLRQLLVDISALVQGDAKSDVQRVVRSVLQHWLMNPPQGWTVEPVYAKPDALGYYYARRFTSRFLDIFDGWVTDEPVQAWREDVFVGLDLQPNGAIHQQDALFDLHCRGVRVHFVVYDLLPILMPDFFVDGGRGLHQGWLEAITRFDGAICISQAVANELAGWLEEFKPQRGRRFDVSWFHLGADTENSVPTTGMPSDAPQLLTALNARPSFLSIGTIEQRKGQAQMLSAFESLWAQGCEINLVLVGKEGWKVDALVGRLRGHFELGKRLFWLEGISDEYLERVYCASSCLVAASEGEGFGLPLIEAAQHGLPIIARDIPVFREVAGMHAFYFRNDNDPQVLADAIQEWLALDQADSAPQSKAMPWLTWAQSAAQLLNIVVSNNSLDKEIV